MRTIDLMLKDLSQLVRDWRSALFLLALPVVFTLMFGFAFGGFGGKTDSRLPVGFLDQENGGLAGTRLLDLLKGSGAIRPVVLRPSEAADLDTRVKNAELAAVVTVPAGYTAALLAGNAPQVEVVADPGLAGQTAQTGLEAAVSRLAGAAEAARLDLQAYEEQARLHADAVKGFTSDAERQQYLAHAVDEALAAWQAPQISVAVGESGAATSGQPAAAQNGFLHTSPSMMVQFSMAGLIGAASLLVVERKTRTLRRLLTTAVSRWQIVVGHYLAMVVMILAQLVGLVAFGQLLLRVPYLRAAGGTALMILTSALWTAGLGLLIGTFAKGEEQVILYALIPMFVLGGMGGAWVPLEVTGKTFSTIAHVLPTAWAIDGFENIVIRGLGLASVLLPAAILFAYAVALFLLALWRFRYE